MSERQEILDRFYFTNGPCCAGCDWWRHISSLVGECTRSSPVSGAERLSMLGIEGCSRSFGSGHVLTNREHICGDFKDEFDWTSLPLPYRKRVGAPHQHRGEAVVSEISSLRKRVDGWELNSGKARVSVPLRELRATLAYIDAMEAAGRPLSNAAFNISRMSPPQIDASHLVSLRQAQEAWDAALFVGEKP